MKEDLRLIKVILVKYFSQYRKQLVFTLLLLLLSSLISLIIPYVSKYYIDTAIPSDTISILAGVLIAYLILSCVNSVMNLYQEFILARLNMIVLMKMRKDIVTRIHRLPMLMFQEFSEEYLFNRTMNDTVYIMESFITSAIRIVQNVTIIIIGIICILMLNVYLSLVVISILALNVFISQYWGKILARLQKQLIENYTIHSSAIQSTIKHTLTVKLFNLYYSINKSILDSFRKYYRVYCKYLKRSYASGFIGSGLQTFCRILIMFIGGILIIKGRFTIGSLFAFLAYFEILNSPALELTQNIMNFKKNFPVYGRVYEMLNFPTEYPLEHKKTIYFDRSVSLCNVSFSYQNNCMILNNVSVTFNLGRIYLITGASGSGKTTIASILLGINRVQSGTVKFDGIELDDGNIESIRDNSAYVEQEPSMMHDTIYNNILIGNMRAKESDVINAARNAYVDEFVEKLPLGYQTKLGSDGITLSIGQKQRIAIARCILRNPKLLILDEPVSSVDPLSENMIYQTVKMLSPSRIVIIISHKKETSAIVDVVLEIKDSKLMLLSDR